MKTKSRQTEKEYVTKTDLKEELSSFSISFGNELKVFMHNSFEEFGQLIVKSFNGLYSRLDSLESEMATKATKQDILSMDDNLPHRREFDELSLRVHGLEKKNNNVKS
jgi:hypothetical protein